MTNIKPIATRRDEMEDHARAFHAEFPMVWRLFCRFTFELISRGFKNYSAQAVFERIRWETDQADYDGRATFKINNNHRAFYARWFMVKYPDYDGFFRTRHQISSDEPPAHLPPLGPEYFDDLVKDSDK